MSTHRSPKPVAHPSQPVQRAVTIALVLSVAAGFAWIGGMIYTLWP